MHLGRPMIGALMDALNPMIVRMTLAPRCARRSAGVWANINRDTVENMRRAGLQHVTVANVGGELVKLIHARA